MKKILTTLILTIIASSAFALAAQAEAPSYTLKYQGANRWVAKEDAKELRTLIRTAKAMKAAYFKVALPEDKRDVSVGRLIVLRDILEKQLKRGVIIEEVEEMSESNTIQVTLYKATE